MIFYIGNMPGWGPGMGGLGPPIKWGGIGPPGGIIKPGGGPGL
jgi:hypothetical protein